jgi:hypothetical protein
MNLLIGKDVEVSFRGLFGDTTRKLSGGTEENHEYISEDSWPSGRLWHSFGHRANLVAKANSVRYI